MQDAVVEVEPEAALAEVSESPFAAEAGMAGKAGKAGKAKKAGKDKKKNLKMRTVSTTLIKFHSFQKRGKDEEAEDKHAVSKKTRERNESLEGPCGLGCIVIPSCQRLNNIQCFLVFLCILVTSQGEPE